MLANLLGPSVSLFQNKILTFALVLLGPSEASTASSSGVTAHQVQNPRGSLSLSRAKESD